MPSSTTLRMSPYRLKGSNLYLSHNKFYNRRDILQLFAGSLTGRPSFLSIREFGTLKKFGWTWVYLLKYCMDSRLSAHQIPRILGWLRWTLTQVYWASKSQPGYPRILGGLTGYPICKNNGWADHIRYSTMMGGLRASDTQDYWVG